MADMRSMEIWINLVTRYQGPEGVSSSVYIRVCRVSVNRPRAGIQLVVKGDTEEEVENNIHHQEEECSIY